MLCRTNSSPTKLMENTDATTQTTEPKVTRPNTSALPDVFYIPTPDNRPLKCYAFDPSHGKFFGNEMTLHVKYEKLSAGPIGESIAVVHYDSAKQKIYKPVNPHD